MSGDYLHCISLDVILFKDFIHCKQTEFKSTCNMECIVTSLTVLYFVIVSLYGVIFDLAYFLLISFNFNPSMDK